MQVQFVENDNRIYIKEKQQYNNVKGQEHIPHIFMSFDKQGWMPGDRCQ